MIRGPVRAVVVSSAVRPKGEGIPFGLRTRLVHALAKHAASSGTRAIYRTPAPCATHLLNYFRCHPVWCANSCLGLVGHGIDLAKQNERHGKVRCAPKPKSRSATAYHRIPTNPSRSRLRLVSGAAIGSVNYSKTRGTLDETVAP